MASHDQSVWTVGHSTKTIAEFLELLLAAGIELLADVRRFPASRRHPHFNREALTASLAEAGIAYQHFPGLGGRRSARLPDSPNGAWRVESFNAYADHLQSAEFQADFDRLASLATSQRTAIMCAEALALPVPSADHRRRAGGPRLAGQASVVAAADRRSCANALRKSCG